MYGIKEVSKTWGHLILGKNYSENCLYNLNKEYGKLDYLKLMMNFEILKTNEMF